jgi:hypothetical protein
MATNKKGGGIGSRQVREVGQRLGRGAQEMRPRGVSQIGESIGNKSTETGKVKGIPSEKIQGKRLPPSLSVPLGNEIATKGLGVGGGRKLYGQSGSNQTYGKPVTGLPRIANTKGQWPD